MLHSLLTLFRGSLYVRIVESSVQCIEGFSVQCICSFANFACPIFAFVHLIISII